MISKEDKIKIEDFKNIFRMTVNFNNDELINKVVDDLFKNVECIYEEYKDEISYVPVEQETYKYHILQPVNGKYSLLDFLLNRAISNIDRIYITDENSYSTDKLININKSRYEEERTNYSDTFIEMQYRKSRLHETGHALHALDANNDDTIHSKDDVDFKKKVKLFNELLGYKYSNLLQVSDIKNKSQKIYGWRGGKTPFLQFSLDEASTEYFATKYSGLYADNKNDGLSYICQTIDKIEGVMVPNRFNGYSTGSCLMYHLENLVSKKSIFQSMFFANGRAIEEFVIKYSKQIENVLERYKKELQVKFPELNQFKTYGKFLSIFLRACTPQSNGFCKEVQEKNALYYEIISKMFAYSYVQEYNSGRISKEKMLEILPMAYRLSPVVVDKTKNEWIDSAVRKGYKTMFKELQNENINKSKITPNSISNAMVQTMQKNQGELSNKVNSVSKSFYDSLKRKDYLNDIKDENSTGY